jgi:Protein of unknown function (DUF998)
MFTTVEPACTPTDRVTRSLLGYGVLAGVVYVGVSLTEALTREGFDLGRHSWSLLATGSLGWIHVATFVVTGLMVIAFAVGLRRALTPGAAARWAPRLLGAYGACLVAAGIFRADPAQGFPVGTPQDATAVSWHGALHLLAGGVGFVCVAAAGFVVARRYRNEGRRGWAVASRAAGVVLLATFAMMASTAGARPAVLAFTAGVILTWAWLAAVAVDRYRRVAA